MYGVRSARIPEGNKDHSLKKEKGMTVRGRRDLKHGENSTQASGKQNKTPLNERGSINEGKAR